MLTLQIFAIAFSALYRRSTVGDFSNQPNLRVPPEFASRVFSDLPLKHLVVFRLDITSYRLISNMTQLETLSVEQTVVELLNFTNWTQLTSLTLDGVGLPNLASLAPLIPTLQKLDLSSSALTNVNALSDFSKLSTVSLQFPAAVTNVPLPTSAKSISLSCIPTSCGVTSLTIPHGAVEVFLSLPSLTSFNVPEGVTSLEMESISCTNGYYPQFPSTLESLAVSAAKCNFLDFSTLTRLKSFSISSYSAGFTYAPDLSRTSVQQVSMLATHHVNETWLCTLPTTLQSLTVRSDGLFTSFPSCFQSLTNLTELHLLPTPGSGSPVMASIGYYLLLENLLIFDFGSTLLNWPFPVSSMTNLKQLRLYNIGAPYNFPNSELSNLTRLEDLELSFNSFTGSMDSNFFAVHPSLKQLSIKDHGITGTFPSYGMQNLVKLDISNTGFTHLPDPAPAATALQTLSIDSSSISNFPSKSAFLSMTSLLKFNMGGLSSLTGGSTQHPGHIADDMPDFWATHPTLQYFHCAASHLNGTLPAFITAPNLRYVAISDNLLGPKLPSFAFSTKVVMEALDFGLNQFTGTVPFSLGDIGFTWLNLASNHLDGCFQTYHLSEATRSMGTTLQLNNNNFSGPLPDLSRLGSMAILDLSNNEFDLCASNPDIQLVPLYPECYLTQSAESVASGVGSSCNCNATYAATSCSFDYTCAAPAFFASPATDSVSRLCAAPPMPSTPPPPFSVDFPCPLPQPQGNFYCGADGNWISYGSVTQPTLDVPSGHSIVVTGNLTLSSAVTFSGLNSTIYVQGCVFLPAGQITVKLSPQEVEQTKHLQKTLIQSSNGNNCDGATDLSQVVVTAKPTKSTCKKVKVNTKDSSTKETLNAVFSIDSSSCNTWWIILASVLGGVLLIIVAMMLLVTFNKTLKMKVRPFWMRANTMRAPTV